MKSSKSLLKITASALGILHLVNLGIDFMNTGNNTTKTDGKYYHWKNGDIYYKKSGEGEPLLLIHDTTVYSSTYEWSQVIDTLSEHYTVYVLDLLGCGRSEKPSIIYTSYLYVQLISDFVKEVIEKKTKVAVTGLSAEYVIMANAMDQELFSDIMMVNPKNPSILKKTPDQRSKSLIRLFQTPIIGKLAFYIHTCMPNTENYLTEKCFHNPFKLSQDMIKAYYNAAHTSNGEGKMLLASLEGYYLNIDITKAMKEMNQNITVIFGEYISKKDDQVKIYSEMNENIRFRTVKNTVLLPQLENSDDMIKELLTF